MKLICELTESVDYELIEEGAGGKKQSFIEGILCSRTEKQERTNLSKRSSSERGQSLRQRVRRTKTSFGELGHPDGPTVNLDRVSHMITELVEDGKNFIGRQRFLTHRMVRS